jgi:hypothetical protein
MRTVVCIKQQIIKFDTGWARVHHMRKICHGPSSPRYVVDFNRLVGDSIASDNTAHFVGGDWIPLKGCRVRCEDWRCGVGITRDIVGRLVMESEVDWRNTRDWKEKGKI